MEKMVDDGSVDEDPTPTPTPSPAMEKMIDDGSVEKDPTPTPTPSPAHMVYERFRSMSLGEMGDHENPVSAPPIYADDSSSSHSYVNWPRPIPRSKMGRGQLRPNPISQYIAAHPRTKLESISEEPISEEPIFEEPIYEEPISRAAISEEPIYEDIDSDFFNNSSSGGGSDIESINESRFPRDIRIPSRMAPESIPHFLDCVDQRRREFGLSGKSFIGMVAAKDEK